MEYRYFILDGWSGETVGNPKGYTTMKGANIALSRPFEGCPKLRYWLWDMYDKQREKGYTGTLIYSIEYRPTVD